MTRAARSSGSRGNPRTPLPGISPIVFGILILIVTVWALSMVLTDSEDDALGNSRLPFQTSGRAKRFASPLSPELSSPLADSSATLLEWDGVPLLYPHPLKRKETRGTCESLNC